MENKSRVPVANKVAYAVGTGAGNIYNQIAAAFLLQYYTDTALISAGAIATMFLVCRVFDGISDFVMGAVIDRTHSKLGKARPWLLLSAPLMLIGMFLLMNVPMGASDGGKLIYAYATYIFMNCIIYTIYGISNTAMLPLMSDNPKEHTMLATFQSLGNNIIGLIAGSAITPLVMSTGWRVSSIVLGAIAMVLILLSGLMNKELGAGQAMENGPVKEAVPMGKQLQGVLKNKYFYILVLLGIFPLLMNANTVGAQIFYCNIVLENPGFMSTMMFVSQFPGIVIMFLMPHVANKYSKQAFLTLGAVLLIIGFAITGFAGTNTALLIVGTVIRALGAGPLLGGVFALIPDVVDYGEWKYGTRSEGLISSAQSIGTKVGIGVGSALTGWILAAVHYNPMEAPTEAVMSAVKFDFTWLGVIISAVILVIVLFMNVEKYAKEYRKA